MDPLVVRIDKYPKLDRAVTALKVLQTQLMPEKTRLMCEAKAIEEKTQKAWGNIFNVLKEEGLVSRDADYQHHSIEHCVATGELRVTTRDDGLDGLRQKFMAAAQDALGGALGLKEDAEPIVH